MTTNSTHSTASSTNATIEDVGIIVGRFQTPYLHDGHKALINKVLQSHKHVTIFLGVSPNKRSRRNPLDFEARRRMIQEDYRIPIHPLSDIRDDDIWSRQLDAKIREIHPFSKVRLYGGRDSFIEHYLGLYPTTEIESHAYHSATSLRDEAGRDVRKSREWRAGVIYGAYNQYPKTWATVDVAPIRYNEDGSVEVLLARKPGEKDWRFIGGFSDPSDPSFEVTGRREVMEEASISVDSLEYICSQRIDDWRYKEDTDKVITTFFTAIYTHGRPEPKDDIEEVAWFTFDGGARSFYHAHIVTAHMGLASNLKDIAERKGWNRATKPSSESTKIIG